MGKDDKEKIIAERWKKLQELQGYTDEEMVKFRSNPNYVKAMEHSPMFITHRIYAEVVESPGCNAGYKPGDKFVMTGNGYLIRDECPKYLCPHAIAAFAPYIYSMWDRMYENLDPDGMLFNLVHCPDVGIKRGGWGECIMKVYAKEVPKEKRIKIQGAKMK